MAYRVATQRQLRQLGHLVKEYVGDVLTIAGPEPESGLMFFGYNGRGRFGGYFIDRKGGQLTAHEAGWPNLGGFGVRAQGQHI